MFQFHRFKFFFFILLTTGLVALSWQPVISGDYVLRAGPNKVERVLSNLKVPWSIAFLPGCELLITERRGNLFHFDAGGKRTKISHGLKINAKGQGGLLDVVAATSFEDTREVYLSYSSPNKNGRIGTVVSKGILSPNNSKLQKVTTIFTMQPGSAGNRHYGSRIVEHYDGTLFITLGDRGDRDTSQDLTSHNGSIVRINTDGTVPESNPFHKQDNVLPEIWSYGHRNPQGADLDLAGNLLVSEHGPKGGDEVNLVIKGKNYGWPIIGYGTHYSGQKIGVGTKKEGLEQPKHYWDPSIAPSGLMVYSGKLWPEMKGNIFVGSLKFDYISRIDSEKNYQEVEKIVLPETKRVRDIREAPDGTIWFISEDRGSVYRILPNDYTRETTSCDYPSS